MCVRVATKTLGRVDLLDGLVLPLADDQRIGAREAPVDTVPDHLASSPDPVVWSITDDLDTTDPTTTVLWPSDY